MLHGSVFLPLFLSLCPIYEDIYESQVCVFLSKIDTPVVLSVFLFFSVILFHLQLGLSHLLFLCAGKNDTSII